MRLSSLLVCVCLLAAVSSAARTRRQSGTPSTCQDFAGRSGTCGPIQECPVLFSLISGGRRPSSEEITNLRASVCGRRKGQMLVCCASPELHPNRALLEQGKLCGTSVHSRIRGGTEVPLGKYPWVALLGYTEGSSADISFKCGGSLIGLQHVLTAAHCVSEPLHGYELKSVRLGEHDLDKETDCQLLTDGTTLCNSPQNFQVEELFVHESYDTANSHNDIALLKLDRPVIEDYFVGTICLPFGATRLRDYTGVNMTAAGFGRVGPNQNSPSSSVLLEVQLPGVEQQQCDNKIRSVDASQELVPTQICAGGEPGRDSCGGDSGGPVIAATPTGPPSSLIGVISFGAHRCGTGSIPSVNTRVSEYLDWILDRVE